MAVFVRGYNYSFQESLFRLAQMNADVGVGGAAVLFAWPSAASVGGYVEDRDSASYSRDELAHVLARLLAPFTRGIVCDSAAVRASLVEP